MTDAASYRQQVHRRLHILATGRTTPEPAATWAVRVMETDVEVDEVTWQGLDHLAGADLLVGPGTLLHGPGDYADWLAEFELGIQEAAPHPRAQVG